jgi:hypothetical protein
MPTEETIVLVETLAITPSRDTGTATNTKHQNFKNSSYLVFILFTRDEYSHLLQNCIYTAVYPNWSIRVGYSTHVGILVNRTVLFRILGIEGFAMRLAPESIDCHSQLDMCHDSTHQPPSG